jgi:hypothetical protein
MNHHLGAAHISLHDEIQLKSVLSMEFWVTKCSKMSEPGTGMTPVSRRGSRHNKSDISSDTVGPQTRTESYYFLFSKNQNQIQKPKRFRPTPGGAVHV